MGGEIHKKYDIKTIGNSFCFLFNNKANCDSINLFDYLLPEMIITLYSHIIFLTFG